MNKIELPKPEWGSKLSDIILELEKLRSPALRGSVPPYIFIQLKSVFHMIETLGSARIEGNHTTLADYVENKLSEQKQDTDPQKELDNIEAAIGFIEETLEDDIPINRAYISELHKMIVKDLSVHEEGSRSPGELRQINVKIAQSKHSPPDALVLEEKFDEFLELINWESPISFQLLAVAISHHRFAYIHPFDNGNGRLGRVLSYALLIKSGFNVKKGGRIMNPSAVFYANRDEYYNRLSAADSLSDKDLLAWAEYYLSGLLDAIVKIDKLLDKNYMVAKLLLPALQQAVVSQRISKPDFEIFKYLITKNEMSMKSEELSKFGYTTSKQKSAVISRLKNDGLLMPTKPNGRTYTIKFVSTGLLRDVIERLREEGFVADFLEKN
ncbi:MAG: Fic family protein [Bacteroidota bacterium]